MPYRTRFGAASWLLHSRRGQPSQRMRETATRIVREGNADDSDKSCVRSAELVTTPTWRSSSTRYAPAHMHRYRPPRSTSTGWWSSRWAYPCARQPRRGCGPRGGRPSGRHRPHDHWAIGGGPHDRDCWLSGPVVLSHMRHCVPEVTMLQLRQAYSADDHLIEPHICGSTACRQVQRPLPPHHRRRRARSGSSKTTLLPTMGSAAR